MLFKVIDKTTPEEEEYYRKFLELMEKSNTWKGQGLDDLADFYANLSTIFSNYAFSFLKKFSFEIKLGITLCCETLEYMKSKLLKEKVHEVAEKMFSHLLDLSEENHTYIMKKLDSIAPDVEVENGNNGREFVKVVCEYATTCCERKMKDFCVEFATYLNKKADKCNKEKAHIKSILKIIVKGLHLVNCKVEDLYKTLIEGEVKIDESLICFESLGLSISNKNEYKPSMIKQHLQSQSSVQPDCETSMIYLRYSIVSLNLVCNKLIELFQLDDWTWTNKISTIVKDKDICKDIISAVMTVLHVQCQLILTSISVTSENTSKEQCWMGNVAGAAFSLSINIDYKLQRSTEIIKDMFLSKQIETTAMNNMIDWLNKGARYFKKINKESETLKVRSLSCDVFWLFFTSHPREIAQDVLNGLSLATYKNIDSYLNLLNGDDGVKREKVIEFLEDWSTASECQSKTFPTPVNMVKIWVECQCKDQSGKILYDLLASKVSRKLIVKLSELEYNFLNKMDKDTLPYYCNKMKQKIIYIFMTQLYTTPKSGRDTRSTKRLKWELSREVVECLNKTKKIMERISKGEETSPKVNPIYHLLYMVSYLHELSKSATDSLKTIFEDLEAFYRSIVILLYNILDLLQLKGFVDSSKQVYQQLIRMHKYMDFSSDKLVKLLWESRRLSHPICVSPLDWSYIEELPNTSQSSKNVAFINCLKNNSLGFQQNFFFLFENSHTNDEDYGKFFQIQTDISDVKIQEVARDLSLKDPKETHSIFLAGYLYIDLAQRLIAQGKLMEALLFAKDSLRIHSKLFENAFKGDHVNFSTDMWETVLSIAGNIMLSDSSSRNYDETYISPWKILQGYLESILQVGTIYEIIGDGDEAVVYLEMGRKVSYAIDSPVFMVSFFSLLGKVHTHQGYPSLAQKELKLALDILEGKRNVCCTKCQSLMHASVTGHVGDLFQIHPGSLKQLSCKENVYKASFEKLTLSIWKNSISCNNDRVPKSVECSCFKAADIKKKSPENKNADKQVEENKVLNQLECRSYSSCAANCSFYKLGCWRCLPSKVLKSGRLSNLIELRWEFVRRKMSIKLLSGSGKYYANSNQPNEIQKCILKRIAILVGENTFSSTLASIPEHHFSHLVATENSNDVFAIERAEIIKDICFYLMKNYGSDSVSKIFSNQSSIKLEEINSWLIKALVLSRDVPIVQQEVSKLLAVIYEISSVTDQHPLSFGNGVSKKRWVFYFHQLSVGALISSKFLVNKFKDSSFSDSSHNKQTTVPNLLRIAKTTKDVEDHMKFLLDNLPSATIVCMSCMGHEYNSLLKKFLPHQTHVRTWMMISSHTAKRELLVKLFPLNLIPKEISSTYKEDKKVWQCPWDISTMDDVVPDFRMISQQYYYMLWDTVPSKENKKYLKSRAKHFDQCLKKLLRKIEDSWFGPDTCLLLGETLNQQKAKGSMRKDPIILVLDYDVQMLPWENLPSLKDHEIYRMPSLGSIYGVLDNCKRQEEPVQRSLGSFPSINPLYGYSILNPDGTLKNFQNRFENYFKGKNLEGKTNVKPTVTEWIDALQTYDIFIYLGHGSGQSYISRKDIKNLKKCGAVLLIGCSSGSLWSQGIYAPVGMPISYLLAGSPIVVGNLWNMLESELCLFSENYFKEIDSDLLNNYGPRRRIGDFVRQACKRFDRPVISGASVVCYGVPVEIKRPADSSQ